MGESPGLRCATVGWDGAVAADECRGACGCSLAPTGAPTRVPSPAPSPRPTSSAPSGSPAPTSEVLFFFDFDDGTGTGYGQSTTDIVNGWTISDTYGSSKTTGPFGTPARYFGGLHGFEMDDVVPKLTGSKSRTMGAWLRIDAYDGAYILMIGGGDDNCQHFGLRAGFEEEALEVAFKGRCSATVNKTNVTAGEWHHVAIVYEENVDWRLHVDGEVVAAGTAALDTPTTNSLRIGGKEVFPFTGAIDDLFAYGAALDTSIIRGLYEAGGFTQFPTAAPAAGPTAAARPPSPAPTKRAAAAPTVERCAYGHGLDFSAHVVDDAVKSPSFTWGVDLDQDGDMDVLTTSLHDNTLAWSENDGAQAFSDHLITTSAMSAAFAAYGDVNDDGALDVLAVSWGDNATRVFENDGQMSFYEFLLDAEEAPTAIVVLDFDGDGDSDALASAWADGTVFWFSGGSGARWQKSYVATGLAGPWSVFPADIDGDADLDVLVATGYDYAATWYENDGDMNFSPRVVDTELIQPREVVARDADGDGDVDLFVAVRGASELVWYDNDGRCDFDKYVISDEADGAYTVFATDLDGDGDIDVIGANKDGGEIPWYENDGAMGFDEHMVSTTADGVRYVVASDMDGDADLDVLAALADADATVWYENGCDNQDYAPATTILAMGLDPDALPESYYTT